MEGSSAIIAMHGIELCKHSNAWKGAMQAEQCMEGSYATIAMHEIELCKHSDNNCKHNNNNAWKGAMQS